MSFLAKYLSKAGTYGDDGIAAVKGLLQRGKSGADDIFQRGKSSVDDIFQRGKSSVDDFLQSSDFGVKMSDDLTNAYRGFEGKRRNPISGDNFTLSPNMELARKLSPMERMKLAAPYAAGAAGIGTLGAANVGLAGYGLHELLDELDL